MWYIGMNNCTTDSSATSALSRQINHKPSVHLSQVTLWQLLATDLPTSYMCPWATNQHSPSAKWHHD